MWQWKPKKSVHLFTVEQSTSHGGLASTGLNRCNRKEKPIRSTTTNHKTKIPGMLHTNSFLEIGGPDLWISVQCSIWMAPGWYKRAAATACDVSVQTTAQHSDHQLQWEPSATWCFYWQYYASILLTVMYQQLKKETSRRWIAPHTYSLQKM